MSYDKTIFFLLNRTSNLIERQVNAIFRECDIEFGSFLMLCAINDSANPGMNVLAKHLGIDPSGLSHVVSRLSRKGFLSKKVGLDKRTIVVKLTAKGRATIDKYMPLVDNLNKEILANEPALSSIKHILELQNA